MACNCGRKRTQETSINVATSVVKSSGDAALARTASGDSRRASRADYDGNALHAALRAAGIASD